MSKSVNVDFVTRQIEVDTDGKEHFISAAMAAKDAEQSMLNAQNAATSVQKYKALWFDSVAAMKAEPSLTAGAYVNTAGYYEINDDGGASYLIREKLESDIDDGGSLHQLSNGLVAELIIENGTVNVKQFGAKGDGISDDYTALYNCLNSGKTVIFSCNKTYYISQPLIVNGINSVSFHFMNSTIKGFGIGGSAINNVAILTFTNCSHFEICDLNTDTQATWIYRIEPYDAQGDYANTRAKAYDGLCVNDCNNFKIKRCHSENSCAGFMIGRNSDFIIENCSTYKTLADGFFVASCERGLVTNCYVEKAEDDCFSCHSYSKQAKDVEFINCKAYDCFGSIVATLGGYNIKYDNCIGLKLRQTPFKAGAYTEGTDTTVFYDADNIVITDCIGICDEALTAEQTAWARFFPSTISYPAKNLKFIRSICKFKGKESTKLDGVENLLIEDSVIDQGEYYIIWFTQCKNTHINNTKLVCSQLAISDCYNTYMKGIDIDINNTFPINLQSSTNVTLLDFRFSNSVETEHLLYLNELSTEITTNIDRIAGYYGETLIHTVGINQNLENLGHLNFAPYSMYMKSDGKLYVKGENGAYIALATIYTPA